MQEEASTALPLQLISIPPSTMVVLAVVVIEVSYFQSCLSTRVSEKGRIVLVRW